MPCMGSHTNCIMVASIDMAPTAISPPYFKSEELKHTDMMLSVNCMTKGESPRAIQGSITFVSGLMQPVLRRSEGFSETRNFTAHMAETA